MTEEQSKRSTAAPWGTWAVSIVNGFWGDYLSERGNGLAVEMALYQHGAPLPLDRRSLKAAHERPTSRVCVLVHGLACNELHWSFTPPAAAPFAGSDPQPPTDYGKLLQADLGFTPYYLRYNSGLSVAANGKALSRLLEDLYANHPVPIEELLVVAHSMGGLVVRSACHYGTQHQSRWVGVVKHLFYLGTPHDGADLARLANTTTGVLQAVPLSIPRLIGDFINLRSQGIKDLTHGTLLEPDVIDEGWDDTSHHHQRPVPWLPHAQHYLVAGSVTGDANHVVSVLLGDGLVGAPANRDNAIAAENIRLFPGVRHLQLTRSWDVYQQIRSWRQAAGEKE